MVQIQQALSQHAARHFRQAGHVFFVVPTVNFIVPSGFGVGFHHIVVLRCGRSRCPHKLHLALHAAHLCRIARVGMPSSFNGGADFMVQHLGFMEMHIAIAHGLAVFSLVRGCELNNPRRVMAITDIYRL